ncbi:MAG: PRC-barrel domain-containing protein, partial [Gemmatimonadetes bacterium]|nr:PRC-barrel domain-containing protein [Gemmatimonadota bacterium]
METNSFDRVVPLSQLDGYGVADGDPDIRGWEVYSQDGRKIGSVDQLLVDRDAMKVSHMEVDVDEQLVARRD